jgi:hypothetical protein
VPQVTVDPADLATPSDLARLFGVGRAAISNWFKRYEDFPAPELEVGATKLYSITAVKRWAAESGILILDRSDAIRFAVALTVVREWVADVVDPVVLAEFPCKAALAQAKQFLQDHDSGKD